MERILDDVATEVRKHYYDPKLHGLDWDGKVAEAKRKIENASSRNLAFANVAAMLDALGDSHTYFIPFHSFGIDYGWRTQAIGDRCFVTRVRPHTDAESKLHPGDEVLLINGYKPTRANLTRLEYLLDVLRPQTKLEVEVRSPEGIERKFEVLPKVFEGQLMYHTRGDIRLAMEQEDKRIRPRLVSLDNDVLVAQVPQFGFTEAEAGDLTNAGRKHKALVLDLRGNPGGQQDALKLLLGRLFDHEIKIADVVSRDGSKPLLVKPDHHPFLGNLIVLVDSKSSSAAEIFARIIQLEKRGTVVGDRSAGAVMEASLFSEVSADTVFALSITVGNMIMPDGSSLEHVGVTPDQIFLPSPDDLVHGRDPVLAQAAAMAGAKLSPEDAGKLFPYEWEDRKPLITN